MNSKLRNDPVFPARWFDVESCDLTTSKANTVNGVRVVTGLSPIDIPDAVGTLPDLATNGRIVAVRYLDNDPNVDAFDFLNEPIMVKHPPANPYDDVIIGRNSGRLYGVKIVPLDADDGLDEHVWLERASNAIRWSVNEGNLSDFQKLQFTVVGGLIERVNEGCLGHSDEGPVGLR